MLNDLGFVWNRRSKNWNENFQRLKRWSEEHGSCHIPDGTEDPELVALSKWIADQRGETTAGLLNYVTQRRITPNIPNQIPQLTTSDRLPTTVQTKAIPTTKQPRRKSRRRSFLSSLLKRLKLSRVSGLNLMREMPSGCRSLIS
jgi:hypothetical protein